MLEDLYEFNSWRKELPADAISSDNISVWSVLKQVVGKPLSFLQRLAEYMEYSELLKLADQCNDGISRLEYVAAFAVSTLSSNNKRMSKPFNPLLFETFELDRSEEEGFRFVAEQVSHHPPVSAFHTEAPAFEFYGTVSPRIRFWGVSLEVQTGGSFTLKLLRHNETYTWDSVNCSIHNIIVGELYLTLQGTMHIRCSSGLEAKVKMGKETELFEGTLYESDKKVKGFYGNWTSFFASCSAKGFDKIYKDWEEKARHSQEFKEENVDYLLIEDSTILWKARPRPKSSTRMYHFTNFTLLLNDPAFITHCLPKTDSRLRPDVRLLEEKRVDEAAKEKNRLEVKQRDARDFFTKNNIEITPRWFEKQKTKNGKVWIFNNKYWERKFEECEDIF